MGQDNLRSQSSGREQELQGTFATPEMIRTYFQTSQSHRNRFIISVPETCTLLRQCYHIVNSRNYLSYYLKVLVCADTYDGLVIYPFKQI